MEGFYKVLIMDEEEHFQYLNIEGNSIFTLHSINENSLIIYNIAG